MAQEKMTSCAWSSNGKSTRTTTFTCIYEVPIQFAL